MQLEEDSGCGGFETTCARKLTLYWDPATDLSVMAVVVGVGNVISCDGVVVDSFYRGLDVVEISG